MSKSILIVTTNPHADMEEEFNVWYDQEHVPERLAVPGFERAQRYYLILVLVPAVQIYPGEALTSRAPRLMMLRFADAAARADDIVLAARSSIRGSPVQQLRVFAAQETADVYVLAEGYLGLEALVRPDAYGDAGGQIDLVQLYARC
jgi:hypothetical protein